MNYYELEDTIEKLYFIEDMSISEIAQELEMSVIEVKNILNKII